ncbi:sensor histidine kinase, partial [Eubacteriales bacterium OttesenSCG-928-A19]|nr:sensor histidine kinase [Eubacteriales bacterium OttesenSCG-928-A19]
TASPHTQVNTSPPVDYVPGVTPSYMLVPSYLEDGEGAFISRQIITDIPRNELLAVLTIDVGVEALDRLLRYIPLYENEVVCLLNSEQLPLYVHGDMPFAADRLPDFLAASSHLLTAPQRHTFEGVEYLLAATKLESHDVYALRIVSYHNLVLRASAAIERTLWIYTLFAAVAAMIGLLLSLRITKPINLLVQAMKRVGTGRFGEHIDVNIADSEIRLLFDRFNTMTDQINQLFRETYLLRLAQQTAELKALQSQINPHFLYNTLQTVHYMAYKRNAYEINMIVDALSAILKYCLNNDSDIVPLSEELKMVDQYLIIQQARFLDRLQVQLDIEEGAESLQIPRMTLQPLVENSVQHGIQESTTSCTVQVRCLVESDTFRIIVSDDGMGMNAEKLQQVRESLHDEVDSLLTGSHIGLRNCWMRLRFLFQEAVEIQVDSTEGEGTTVCISIHQAPSTEDNAPA